MRLSQGSLLSLLQQSVVELRFYRRNEKPGWNMYRRMLCTNSVTLLNSAPGQIALHFMPPTYPPAYNWMAKGLVCSFDIFWQKFRMIPAESADTITVFPVTNEEQINGFWKYFNTFLKSMTPQEKIQFMQN